MPPIVATIDWITNARIEEALFSQVHFLLDRLTDPALADSRAGQFTELYEPFAIL